MTVPHAPTDPTGAGVVRVNLANELDRLLEELTPWRAELVRDIQHAHERGLPRLEADLRRLSTRVEATVAAAAAVRRRT